MKTRKSFTVALAVWLLALTALPEAILDSRERQIRERYEQVLLKNPFQDRAFNQVFESYLNVEGIDRWIEQLKPETEGPNARAALLLLGQIYDRQFRTSDALASLDQAAELGETRPEFKLLLGTLNYKVGRDERAAELLGAALDALTDLDQRSAVCRILGNLYLRQGKRAEAIEVWKRIVEQNPKDMFSLLELAGIYEDNRLWDEALAVYRQIVAASQDDPYRRCRALRSIGQCLLLAERHIDAIAAFEEALGLVAPGNWLFEDLKLRLVGVYEDIGDLAGLVQYIQAQLEQSPADLEFRDLLAETYKRMGKLDLAEQEYRFLLERNPRHAGLYEKLIALHSRLNQPAEVYGSFEKLIEFFPNETDYLRRLGEAYLRDGSADRAKATWQRLVKDQPTGARWAQLAGWYESFEFTDEAIVAYEKALEQSRSKEWVFRVAALKFQQGDEAEALKLWHSALNPETSKPEDYAELAAILEAHQQVAPAGALLQQAVTKAPENLDFRLQLARNLMRQESFETALEHFDALAEHPDNEYFRGQGETGRLDAYTAMGILAEKQEQWERELAQNPKSLEVLTKLARLYDRAGQREKALQLHERRAELEPENLEFLRALAGAYRAARQTEAAIEWLQRLIQTDRNRARAYYKNLLDIYLSVDFKTEAIATAEQIVALAPTDPEARLDLAQVYLLYREAEKALEQFRYALRLSPNEPDYHRQYGDALSQERRWGEAQQAYRKMLETAREDQTRLNAVQSLARIYLQENTLTELLAEFQRRLRNTPKRLAAYEELAAIYKEAGQLFRAVEILESAVEIVDDKAPALRALIRAGHEAQDFPKVRSYFEQLIAMSGKPTPFEYERLGNIYAQLGEIEKARETWNKIAEETPKDPKAWDRLATVLRNEGFTDEALVAKIRAVELEPYHYKRRLEYAQLLAAAQQPFEALQQLQTILELGEREDRPLEETSAEKKVQRLSRGRRAPVSPYQFVYGLQSSVSRYFGGTWAGSFEEYRPQVLTFMAGLAQQSIGDDEFLKEFEERLKKDPDNTRLKRDLLLLYQSLNRLDNAVKLAEEILAVAPDDPDLIQQTALYHSSRQEPAKAIALLERLAEIHPKQRVQAVQGLIPLYFNDKQEEKAVALANQLLEENPNDIQVVYSIGSLMVRQQKWDLAQAIYEKGMEIDPRYRANMLQSLASIYQQSGRMEKAVETYKEALIGDSPGFGGPVRSARQAIYAPAPARTNVRMSSPLGNLPQNVIGYIDYSRAQAIRTLAQQKQGDTNPLADLEEFARTYGSAASAAERRRAWEAAKILLAYYLGDGQLDRAEALLKALPEAEREEIEWSNLALYLEQLRDNHDGMLAIYEGLQEQHPARARELLVARTSTAILGGKYEAAARSLRELNQQRFPPAQFVALVRPLSEAGEKTLARQLLEEHLQTVSRNSDALALLATLYGEDGDHDRAIELATEAWERRTQSRAGSSSTYYYLGYRYPSTRSDTLLRDLHRYYVAAGRSAKLTTQFKNRLEKQPSSVPLHENLAELYRLNNRRDLAAEVYQSLIEKRPHLMQARISLANLWAEQGQFQKATEIYEQLLKTTPGAYQQISWELRNLYQRSGQGKELAKIEDNMAAKANDPNQLRNLAQRFAESGESDKAIELYRKLIKMSPMDSYMKRQLAELLVKEGFLAEALKVYQEWLDAPGTRAAGYVDHYTIKHLAGLYRATGRLEELKERAAKDLARNSTDKAAKGIQAHVAVLEKRFEDALAIYGELTSGGGDPNSLNEVLELAELRGRVDEALAVIEKDPDNRNFWNKQRLAQLYAAKGDHARAVTLINQWVDQQSQHGSGFYYVSEAFRLMAESGLWDEAERFARKHRRSFTSDTDYYARRFDEIITGEYVRENRFTGIIDEIFQRETIRGRDWNMVKAIADQYRNQGQPDRQRALLEQLLEKDPKHRETLAELVKLYQADKEPARALPLAEQLVALDLNNRAYRQTHAQVLTALGQENEALAALAAWAEARPAAPRYTLLATQQRQAGLLRAAHETWHQALELTDASRKLDQQATRAEIEGQLGNPAAAKTALLELFESQKDANSFRRYLTYLQRSGLPREAHEFFLAHQDGGFLDQYRQTEFLDLCFEQSDFATPLDIAWRFVRYSEPYNRDYYFDAVRNLYQNRGQSELFLRGFAERVAKEAPDNADLLQRLATAREEAGFTAEALNLYDQMLKRNSMNRTAASAKSGLLIKLDRAEEALAIQRDPPGIMKLQDEISSRLELARTLFNLGRGEEAQAELRELAAWAGGGESLRQIADLLLQQKLYEEARPYYENAARLHRSWYHALVLVNLGKCRAKAGQTDAALQAWTEALTQQDAEQYCRSLPNWLLNEDCHEAARAAANLLVQRWPTRLDLRVALATVHLRTKQVNEAFQVFAAAHEQAAPAQREPVAKRFAQFILDNSLLDAALKRSRNAPDPFLRKTLGLALDTGARQPPARKGLLEYLADSGTDDPAEMLLLAGGFEAAKQPERAAEWYERALRSEQPDQQLNAARGLAKLGQPAKALPVLLATLEKRPQVFLTDTNLLSGFARAADPESQERLLTALAGLSLFESHGEFYRVALAYFRGETNAALAKIPALTDASCLTAFQLEWLAGICQRHRRDAQAVQFLNRLTSEGHGAEPRWKALSELVAIHSRTANLRDAVTAYSEMFPRHRQLSGEKAADIIAAAVTVENFTSFRDAILAAAQTQPAHDRVSYLIGFCRDLARRLQQPDPGPELMAALPLADWQRADVARWDQFIKDWEVAGPYAVARSVDSDEVGVQTIQTVAYANSTTTRVVTNPTRKLMDAVFAAEAEVLRQNETGGDPASVEWRPVDPAQMFGFIRLDQALSVNERNLARKVGYARTRLFSPEERNVVFALGADDWAKVWVNGQEVFASSTGGTSGSAWPDQHRFVAPLKQGENTLLVKLGNANDAWAFCLRIAEGGQDVRLAQR